MLVEPDPRLGDLDGDDGHVELARHDDLHIYIYIYTYV